MSQRRLRGNPYDPKILVLIPLREVLKRVARGAISFASKGWVSPIPHERLWWNRVNFTKIDDFLQVNFIFKIWSSFIENMQN